MMERTSLVILNVYMQSKQAAKELKLGKRPWTRTNAFKRLMSSNQENPNGSIEVIKNELKMKKRTLAFLVHLILFYINIHWRSSHAKKLEKLLFPAAGLGTRFIYQATKADGQRKLPIVENQHPTHCRRAIDVRDLKEIYQNLWLAEGNERLIEDHFD